MQSGRLPEDLIEDILVKLPVKSIIRFQSASKSWFDLVKSSRFISKHQIESHESFLAMFFTVPGRIPLDSPFLATGSRNNEINICDSKKLEAVYVLSGYNFELLPSYNFVRYLEGDRSWHVAGDCNGILCLTNYKNIMMVNPSWKEAKSLPYPILPEVRDPRGYWRCRLVGFGFDNMTMDFTVVRVLSFENSRGVVVQGRVEVYNLKSNVRRELNEFPLSLLFDFVLTGSTFFNGVIHWCGRTKVSGWGILTFNMANNLFSQLELPQGWYETSEGRSSFRLLVLSQESLACVSYPHWFQTSIGFVNVWIMNEHGTEATWTKLYSIGPLTKFQRPLSFWNKHKFIYKTTDGKLIFYDLVNHNSSVVCDVSKIQLRDDARFKVCSEFGVCRPSLVSINL